MWSRRWSRLWWRVALVAVGLLGAAACVQAETYWVANLPTGNALPGETGSAVGFVNPGAGTLAASVAGPGFFQQVNVAPGQMVFVNVPDPMLTPGIHSNGVFEVHAPAPLVPTLFTPLHPDHSNDATALIPEAQLGFEHFVLSYADSLDPTYRYPADPAYFVAVAIMDDTQVSFTPTADTSPSAAGPSVPATPAGATTTATIDRGEALMVMAAPGDTTFYGDLTGTRVVGDKPIAVYSGSQGTRVGRSAGEAIHDAMPPTSSLGTVHVACDVGATATADQFGQAVRQLVLRIVATRPGTTDVVLDPAPQALADDTFQLDGPGRWVEVAPEGATVITSDEPVLVGAYIGEIANLDEDGDPALLVLPPVTSFYAQHTLTVPPLWASTHGRFAVQTGSTTTLDGAAVSAGPEIGQSGWACIQAALTPGAHTVASSGPAGVSWFGFEGGTSGAYWLTSAVAPCVGAPPTPVRQFAAGTSPTPGEAALSWQEPEQPGACRITHYEIIRGHGGQPQDVVQVEWPALSYLDEVEACLVFDYEIRAWNAAGASAPALASFQWDDGCALAVDAGGPYDVGLGDWVRLEAVATGGTFPYSCAWQASRADFDSPSTCSPLVRFVAPGEHTVVVVASDAHGQAAQDEAVVRVARMPPDRSDPDKRVPPPGTFDAQGGDQDSDGMLDGADNCPMDANPNQQDSDGDGSGDACDEVDPDASCERCPGPAKPPLDRARVPPEGTGPQREAAPPRFVTATSKDTEMSGPLLALVLGACGLLVAAVALRRRRRTPD